MGVAVVADEKEETKVASCPQHVAHPTLLEKPSHVKTFALARASWGKKGVNGLDGDLFISYP